MNLFKVDVSVLHFKNPRVQSLFTSIIYQLFTFHGLYEDKQLTEILPGIINTIWPDKAGTMNVANQIDNKSIDNSDGDDVPNLVEKFEEASKDEVFSSINQEQEEDESELTVTQDKNGVGYFTENNHALALGLANLALKIGDKATFQALEKEITDEIFETISRKMQKTVESDSQSSEDCDNTCPAYIRINHLIGENGNISNEPKLQSEPTDKDNAKTSLL